MSLKHSIVGYLLVSLLPNATIAMKPTPCLSATDQDNILRELIPIIMMIYSLLFVGPSRFLYSRILIRSVRMPKPVPRITLANPFQIQLDVRIKLNCLSPTLTPVTQNGLLTEIGHQRLIILLRNLGSAYSTAA